MKSSIVIPHVPFAQEAEDMLDECLSTLSGYDELILVINDSIGYGAAFNRGFKYAKGEFVLAVSNDTKLIKGSLSDLFKEDCITTPFIEGVGTQFGAFFCMPRTIYEKVGGFDERFKGAYFEDNDLLWRWQAEGIELKTINDVVISHRGGATVKATLNEGELMDRNRQVFLDKWGKLP